MNNRSAVFELETRCLSSLVKVFPDEEPAAGRYGSGSALRGEAYSFQVAYRTPELTRGASVRVELSSPGWRGKLSVREVGLAPSQLPCYGDPDDGVLRGKPGLFPDPLLPLGDGGRLKVPPRQWRALWIEAVADAGELPGVHAISVAFLSEEGATIAKETFALEVLPLELPEQELLHTEWFHADCLATHYGVDVFSERHWELIEAYIATASAHGVNMLLTPLFTPPLDTAVGGERPTVQLVDVTLGRDGKYAFGFEKLTRWIGMAERAGIRFFEFSHLFTQWGAKHAPKIEVLEEGAAERTKRTKRFGWHTDAAGDEYGEFLAQFLPAIAAYVREHGLADRVYFHVSDEPREEHLEPYRIASERLRRHVGGLPVLDALSDFSFYERGLVSRPVAANDHIEPFLEAGVPELWTYYCCVQYKEVANRFFDMPSARSRILGAQLYKFGLKGFLHWGYNFWYSHYSLRAVNPYETTDADCAFPSGDAFLVYPGEEGPVESIRLKVVREALQDLRALRLLERLAGREETLRLLEDGLGEPLTFRAYPRGDAWLLERRERINRALRDRLDSNEFRLKP
ncbi:hypothetical protein J19TS2_47100 [Cohnella xylanilytica]|uniref:DUF4091 domain-containing protein n=1 Tax=Cohnella xylanilytica TaxID=557555 RepID=UPI001B19AA97|nr:DUF4091 domain-containing protein [Cohnella xylanilytica]GIO15155.1 hypothetical protein J19TS2_47100 [Cohnella xylanilytica]